jgi:hypothetical protein
MISIANAATEARAKDTKAVWNLLLGLVPKRVRDGGRVLRRNQMACVISLRLSFMGIWTSSIITGPKGSDGRVAAVVAVQRTVATTTAPGQNRVHAISAGQPQLIIIIRLWIQTAELA